MTKLEERILARREQAGLEFLPAPKTGEAPAQPEIAQPHGLDNNLVDTYDQDAHVLPVSAILVRTQARKSFRRIAELAADIRERGQLQPIVVRETTDHQYVLLSGERRLRAIRDELHQGTIAARLVRSDIDEQSWRLSQLAENLQREDYEPLEIAREFASLKEAFGYSNVTLADKLNISRAWVWRQLTLLEAPANIQESIENGSLAATEYLNNKSLYLSGQQVSVGTSGSDQPARAGSPPQSNIKPISRISKVAVPIKTAQDLVEILKRLSHEHQLSPIVLGKKPTKDELLIVLTTRAQEIKQQLLSIDAKGLIQQS